MRELRGKFIENVDGVFFTSDHHFHHSNIIKYASRPYLSLDEMHDDFVVKWNSVVGENDTVYHLGDFSLSRNPKEVGDVFAGLNGIIRILCNPWHHDGKWMRDGRLRRSPGFEKVEFVDPIVVLSVSEISAEDYPMSITLSHWPMAMWEASHYGAWHIHGHSHGKHYDHLGRNVVDAGVDVWDGYPVSLKEIVRLFDATHLLI